MSENALTTVVNLPVREITPGVWRMIQEIAPVMYRARMFGVSSPEQAIATMLKGYELGFGLTASFEFVKVIQGKPEVIPRGALALLHNNPHIEKIEIKRLADEQGNFVGYETTMRRDNGFEYTARWTMEDARRAGLVKPDSGWEKYPENMCLWRSVGFCADVVAPDITAGLTTLMKMPEAYGVALDESGDVIDVQDAQDARRAPQLAAESDTVTLNDLLAQYEPDEVMSAVQQVTGGRMPGSAEEVQKIAEVLHGAE